MCNPGVPNLYNSSQVNKNTLINGKACSMKSSLLFHILKKLGWNFERLYFA